MAHALGQSDAALVRGGACGLIAARDPRLRIVLACLFGGVMVSLEGLGVQLAALGLALFLLALSRLPLWPTLKRMAMMDGFILFMLVMLPFSVPGEPIGSVWGMSASWEGLWQAVSIALKANAVILSLMVLVGSMEPVTLGHALHALRCPRGLVHLMMFTIRYIDVLREEYLRLRAAMKVRGFRPRSNWHCYRSFGYLVGMMLIRAIERSERIMAAMKCRGFSGQIPLLQAFRLTTKDLGFAALFCLACLALLYLDAL